MGHDGGVAGAVGHLDGVQGLGQGADLVDLDEDGVGDLVLQTHLQALGVGDEEVVAHQLHAVTQSLGQHLPALDVVLAHAVLHGDDGVVVGELLPHVDHLLLGHGLLGLGQVIAAGLGVVPVGHSGVDGDHEVLAGLVAGLLDGGHDALEGVLVLLQVGGVAALVAHAGGGSAVLLEDGLQGVENLGAHLEGLLPAAGAHRHDHELLDVHVVGGVSAAVEDVHHGHGEGLGVDAADIVVEADAQALSGGLGAGQGGTQDGVGAQAALVGGAVELDHGLVDGSLIQHVHAHQALGDLVVDVLHGVEDALAQVAALVAVPELTGLVDAGGGAGGHAGAAHGAVFQVDLHLNGGIAAGVQDLTAQDVDDLDDLLHG